MRTGGVPPCHTFPARPVLRTMGLKHPAEETVERYREGDENAAAMLEGRSRAELLYVAAALADGELWDVDDMEEAVFADDRGNVSKGQLRALVEYVAAAEAEG